jgi:hypothetical protein
VHLAGLREHGYTTGGAAMIHGDSEHYFARRMRTRARRGRTRRGRLDRARDTAREDRNGPRPVGRIGSWVTDALRPSAGTFGHVCDDDSRD